MVQEASENKQRVTGEQAERKETQEQGVSIPLETYNALLDRIAELEAPKSGKRSADDEAVDLDELAKEGRRKEVRTESKEKVDVNSFDNTQLVEHIFAKIDELAGPRIQQIETGVETLRVMREIDKAEVKHTDFWDYEKEIRTISTRNPTLSIEEAYKLAKGDDTDKKGKKKEGEEEVVTTRTEKLLKLPPRVPGEKPGLAPGASKEGETKTLRKAAEKAWDDVVGKGKTEV